MTSQPAVLIVDDEEICVAITRKLLERVGLNVICAADGIEAVHLYEQHRQHIAYVLLDIQMPRMNGVETFRCLKKLCDDVRVIIVSGHFTAANKIELEPLRPVGYVEKPLTIEALAVFLKPLFCMDVFQNT